MVSETNGGHMKRALYTLHHDEGLLRARYPMDCECSATQAHPELYCT